MKQQHLLSNILHLALAMINRRYTNQVRLRGLTQNEGFLTRAGGFCLCSGDFQSPSARYKLSSYKLFSFYLLILTSLLYPVTAGAADITQQLHRPERSSLKRQPRDDADSLLRVAEQQYAAGYPQKALDSGLQALDIYHSLGEVRAKGQTYNLLAKAYIKLGRLKEGEDALRRHLAIARDTQDFQTQIFALNNLGTLLLQAGEPQAAGETIQDAFTIADNVNNIEGEGLSLSNLGLVAARLGHYNKAIKLYETALIYRRRTSDKQGEINTLNNLGDAYLAANNYSDTISSYGAALSMAKSIGDRPNQLRAIDGLVTAHSAVGRYQRALDLLKQRLTIAKELENPREQLNSFASYAKLYEQLGNYPTARNFYERAITISQNLEDKKEELFLRDRMTQMLRVHSP
ncbi:MAG TPA: tetratricopeptide repeat protein [Leptolyngbyaceae cyanobacterium]